MEQIITCLRCGRKYLVAPEWAGRMTNCPGCDLAIQIPTPEPQPVFPPPAPPDPHKRPYPPTSPAYAPHEPAVGGQLNPTHLLLWAGIGGGVLAVLFVLVVAIVVVDRFSKAPVNIAQAPPIENLTPISTPPERLDRILPAGPASSIRPRSLDTFPAAPPPKPATFPQNPFENVAPPAPANAGNNAEPKPAIAPNTFGQNAPAPNPPVPNAPVAVVEPKSPAPKRPVEFSGQVLIDDRGGITFGPPGCPIAVTGAIVWDIDAKKVRAELTGRTELRGMVAISPDGNTVATASKSPNQEDTDVVVWNANTGEQKFTVPGVREKYVDTIYLSNEQLFLGGRLHTGLDIVDLETGKSGRTVAMPDARLRQEKVGFTVDGDYLAVPVQDRLTVFKTSTGKMAAYMGAPKAYEERASDPVFVYAWLQGLKFSPDSLELAAISTHPVSRLICWDNRGKLIYDEPYYVETSAHQENPLQWFPNRQAWLVERHIFDRPSGRFVLSIRKPWTQDLYLHVHDDDRLVGTFPGNPKQVEILEIPWKKIRASHEAMKTKQPALLSPAIPVSLIVDLGEQPGDGAKVLETAFTERLKRDGFTVAPGSQVFFQISLPKSAGDLTPIYDRQRMAVGSGSDTDRRTRTPKGELVAELYVVGSTGPLWREPLSISPNRNVVEALSDLAARETLLPKVTSEIRRLTFPYFIPESKDKDTIALPIVIQ